MITIISSILQWNILMPMKVHDTHGLNIGGAIQKNDSSQITLLSLRFSFSLPYTKTSTYIYKYVWSIISQLECSSDSFQPIISIPLSKAH